MPSPKPFQQLLSETFLPPLPIPHLTWGVLNPKRKWEEGKATGLQVTLPDTCLAQKWPEKCHRLEELYYGNLAGGHRGQDRDGGDVAGRGPKDFVGMLMHVASLSLPPCPPFWNK